MPDLIKVAKFGGTSLADAEAMKRCADIISSDPDKRVVVLSATSGTTNRLTDLATTQDKASCDSIFKKIEKKHLDIVDELGIAGEARQQVRQLLDALQTTIAGTGSFNLQTTDEILSYGERLSTAIFTALLNRQGVGAEFVDAREIIKTNSHYGSAEPFVEQIRKKVDQKLVPSLKWVRMVTQGFIGSNKSGRTTTLGRGGSDYSAALLAEAVGADVLEIWTDVNAIYTTDPGIVGEAKPLTEISFDEAAELSVFGAKVLHPATLKPAIRKNIRVYVASSMEPEKPGTWIVKKTMDRPVIRAISLRREQTLVTVHSLDMLHRHGFLARLFEILADYKISVDLVTTSEVSVSLTIDSGQGGSRQHLPAAMIKELESIADVQVEKGLALIALVGNNLDRTAGVSGRLFTLLDTINIRLICHGASTHNLCFLIDDQQAAGVVRKLHNHFILNREKTDI